MKAHKRTSKKLGYNILDSLPLTLLGLNDGRLAIGGDSTLVIYNMKTYNADIKIEDRRAHLFLLQLKDNSLFYYNRTYETEGGAVDIYFYNNLIELSSKEYKDKTSILPKSSKYNILRQFSDKILYGGINYYEKEFETSKCICTNAVGPNRIEKIIKIDDFENSEGSEKYEIVTSFQIDFIDFITVREHRIAVLDKNSLSFYDVDDVFNLIKKIKVKDGTKIRNFSDKFLLYGTKKEIILFDYINYNYVKSLPLIYSLEAIYVKENMVYVCETASIDFKTYSAKNGIAEYEIDDNGNCKQLSYITNGHKNELKDVTIVKDGRLISCSFEDVKIWS